MTTVSMKIGDIIDDVHWTRDYIDFVSKVEVVKVNRKTIKAKLPTCAGLVRFRDRVKSNHTLLASSDFYKVRHRRKRETK